MLFKYVFGYFRLKLLLIILNRIMGSKLIKSKNMKSMNLLTYALEVLATIYLGGGSKKKVKKTRARAA